MRHSSVIDKVYGWCTAISESVAQHPNARKATIVANDAVPVDRQYRRTRIFGDSSLR